MKEYYYVQNETKHGPIQQRQLAELLFAGEIPPCTLIWSEGFSDWIPATVLVPNLESIISPKTPKIASPPPIPRSSRSNSLISLESHRPKRPSESETGLQFSDSAPTEIDRHTFVGRTTLVHRGQVIPFSEIAHVKTTHFDHTLSVMLVIPINTQGVTLVVGLSNGRIIKAETGSMYVKTDRMKLMAQAAEHVRISTFHARYNSYISELQNNGEIICGRTHIKSDGFIKQGLTSINMQKALASGTFCLGIHWAAMDTLNSKYDPHKIGVSEKKDATHYTLRKIVFKPEWDVDVIWAIMMAIAKGEYFS